METFDKIISVVTMFVGLIYVVMGRVDLATYMMALAAVNFARMAAFK